MLIGLAAAIRDDERVIAVFGADLVARKHLVDDGCLVELLRTGHVEVVGRRGDDHTTDARCPRVAAARGMLGTAETSAVPLAQNQTIC